MEFRRKYFKYGWITLFMLLVVLVILSKKHISPERMPSKACFGGDLCINLEVAAAEEEKMSGLMNRNELDEGSGMLFFYKKLQVKMFWMKDTFIPLDIIWLDEEDRIIYIQRDAHPCDEEPCPTYGRDVPSRHVLEVNGGFTLENDINVGDVVELK